MTISERIEAEKARAAKAIAELETEAELAATLTRDGKPEPKYIHFASKDEPWITFEVKTVAEALALLPHYPPTPLESRTECCRYIKPVGVETRGRLDWSEIEPTVCVEINDGRGFRSRSITWFTTLPDGRTAHVKAEGSILSGMSDWPWQLMPICRVHYDSYGSVSSATHELPSLG